MKILHLNTTIEGGAGHFSNDLKRYLDKRGHENHILTFKDFFKKGFLKRNFFVLIYLIKSYLILRFRKKNTIKIISPLFSLWKYSKIKDLVKLYDLVIVHRFSNFLSFQELVKITIDSKKVKILGIDEGLFLLDRRYSMNGKNYISDIKKFEKNNRKLKDYLRIESLLEKADFSNSEIIIANAVEKEKIKSSFWKKSKIKISTKIFPYQPYISNESLEKIFCNKIKCFENKLKITISALYPSYRKGFDLIGGYLQKLHDLYPSKSHKEIEVNIITKDNSFFIEKSPHPKIKLKFHNILNKHSFELLLAKSHVFLSFSRFDSGPYTLNICYYLHTMILSFNVGVANEIAKKTKSVNIIDNFSTTSMATQTLKIILYSKLNLKSILSYEKDLLWI